MILFTVKVYKIGKKEKIGVINTYQDGILNCSDEYIKQLLNAC